MSNRRCPIEQSGIEIIVVIVIIVSSEAHAMARSFSAFGRAGELCKPRVTEFSGGYICTT
jgi:hypothetical protein